MNFNREEATKAIKELPVMEFVKLIAGRHMFKCTVDDVKEAVILADSTIDCMIHPTNKELFDELIKYLLDNNYDFDDKKDIWYNDDTYIYADSDFYSGMVTIWHGIRSGRFNIITLTK